MEIGRDDIKPLVWEHNGQRGLYLGGITIKEGRITIFEVRPTMQSYTQYEVYNSLAHYIKVGDKLTLDEAKELCEAKLIELVNQFLK